MFLKNISFSLYYKTKTKRNCRFGNSVTLRLLNNLTLGLLQYGTLIGLLILFCFTLRLFKYETLGLSDSIVIRLT